jgi:hypothetical protein
MELLLVSLQLYHNFLHRKVLQWTPSCAPAAAPVPLPTRVPSPPITTTDHDADQTHVDHSQKDPITQELASDSTPPPAIPEPTQPARNSTLSPKSPTQLNFSLNRSKTLLRASFIQHTRAAGQRPSSGVLGQGEACGQAKRPVVASSVSLPLLRTLYMDGAIYFLVVFGMRLFTGLIVSHSFRSCLGTNLTLHPSPDS